MALLLFVTFIFWKCRFERVSPNLLADDACSNPTAWQGTVSAPTVSFSNEGVQLTKKWQGPAASLSYNLTGLENVRYLSMKCDAKWQNCLRDDIALWAMPRIVVHGNDAQGRYSAPLDHGLLQAIGTRGWHRNHTIVELPPELVAARLNIESYGKMGILQVNNLRLEAVRLRSWAGPAGYVLSTAWILWCAMMLCPWVLGSWKWPRSLLLAIGLFAAFWHFVFPQARTLYRPIQGQFTLGEIIPHPPKVIPPVVVNQPQVVKSPAEVQKRQPRLRTITPPPASTPAVPTPPPTAAPPEKREEAHIINWLRSLDRKWNVKKYNLTHFTAFLGVGLAVFFLSGRDSAWRILLVLAIAGEIVPHLIHSIGDIGDLFDLLANVAGLLLAWLIYRAVAARRSVSLVR